MVSLLLVISLYPREMCNWNLNLFQNCLRVRDYLQKERAKYKDLLANAQNDLNMTKSMMERENDLKQSRELSFQQVMDEKTRLQSSWVSILHLHSLFNN